MAKNIKSVIEKDFAPLKGEVIGILMYGSRVTGTDHARSDIDVCLVAGVNDPSKLFKDLLVTNLTAKYDVKIFEMMPLKMKGSILDNHVVVWSGDEGELSLYLHKYARIWVDQKTSLKKLGLKMYC